MYTYTLNIKIKKDFCNKNDIGKGYENLKLLLQLRKP